MELSVHNQYARLPANEPTEFHVLFSLLDPDPGEARPRINLMLVLDRSGSMRDRKIAATREAAKLMVDRLGAGDRLGLVVYGTEVKTLLKPEPLRDRNAVKRLIDSITTGGTTNLSGGWLAGLKLAGRNHSRSVVSRVILMTDGLANRGITNAEKLSEIAQTHSRKGIVTSTMGFGEGFNEECLTSMAQAGGGNFHYIRYADDAPQAFITELGDVMNIAAQNVHFALDPQPGFAITEILNSYPFVERGLGRDVYAGDVFVGEAKKLVLRMQARPAPQGTQSVLRVRVECDLVKDAHKDLSLEREVEASFEEKPAGVLPHEEVVLELGLLRSARVRQKAITLADAGEFGKARKLLEQCVRELEAQKICATRMAPEIEEMARFAAAFGQRQWTIDGRKTLSASVFLSGAGRLMSRKDRLIDTRIDEDA